MRRRIDAAIAFRESLGIDATAYRLVHGEADLLPSLIVDRYGDYLVVQTLSQGMDRLLPVVVSTLTDLLHPRGILARNDPRARAARGARAARRRAGRRGARDACRSRRPASQYDVDLRHGQKTGLFLDQRENRAAAAALRARPAARLLQLQRRLRAGAGPPLPRRRSRSTSPRTRSPASAQNAARNGVAVDARVGNVFDELRGLDRLGERFDTIVLDPPAFAKNKAAVANARAGYKEINLRALKLLNPGGTLVTCSCSYNVNEAVFAEIVYEAAVDAQVHVTVVEKRMQGRDHPVLLGVPETYYLKCFILQKARVTPSSHAAPGGARAPGARWRRMARPAGGFDCEPLLPRSGRPRVLQRRHRGDARARAVDSRAITRTPGRSTMRWRSPTC